MSAVDEIKARLDIVNVIGDYVPLHKAGRNYKALCPFHNEKTPSFVVFPDTQTWRCFGQCGEGGDMFNFVMKHQGWDFSEALAALADLAGVDLTAYSSPQKSDSHDRLYDVLAIAAEFYNDLLPGSIADAYLEQRGISPETAQHFMLGYAPDDWQAALNELTALGFTVNELLAVGILNEKEETGRVYDRFRHRLMIPIHDGRGRVIGFGARAFRDDQQPKYLNSPQTPLFDKSKTLYAYDKARRNIRETETVVIVEGYMDVIQAHQAGYTNVVAQMGTALTPAQLQAASKHVYRIVLSLDSDAAGIKATMKGLNTARETLGNQYTLDARGMLQQAGHLNLDMRVLELPLGEDPDDVLRANPAAWPNLVNEAVPLADYVIQVGTQDLPRKATVVERERKAQELLPLLTATEDKVHQRANVQRLAMRLQLDERTLIGWAQARTTKKAAKPTKPVAAPLSMKGRKLEEYVLSVLLREPERLFEANRLLREAVQTEDGEMGEPLESADFTQSEFQMIFDLLCDACGQDAYEPLDFIRLNANVVLQQRIDTMLAEPIDHYAQTAQKWQATELESVLREQQRRQSRVPDEFPRLILKLRLDRLSNTCKEYYFLQAEAQQSGDTSSELIYGQKIIQLLQFQQLLQRAVMAM